MVRYRKSIRLGGGVRLNLSKSGLGLSAGIPGFRVSTNTSGRTTRTLSVPGTGISSVSTLGPGRRSSGGRSRSGDGALHSVPASQGASLLPKPGWLSGGADKRYYEGVQAFLREDYASARSAFTACLAAEPRATSAHLFAALCLGKIDGADAEQVEHLEAVVGSSEPIPDRLQQKYLPGGLVHLALAVNVTDMISGQAPFDSVGATLMLAEHYQEAGRLEEALGLISAASRGRPQQPGYSVVARGLVLRRSGPRRCTGRRLDRRQRFRHRGRSLTHARCRAHRPRAHGWSLRGLSRGVGEDGEPRPRLAQGSPVRQVAGI